MKKIFLRCAALLTIALSCSLANAQAGMLIDISQGARLVPHSQARYFGALRFGYSMVLDNRTNMSYSWRKYLDLPVIGIYAANPGLPVSLSATLHQFLFAFLPVGFPLFKSLAVYAYADPVGYIFKLSPKDAVGESWYSGGGLEIGTGGVFLKIGVERYHRHDIWIPQAGLKVYFY